MNIYSERASSLIAVILTLFSWLFGGWDLSLRVLVSLMALDYLTGVLKGIYEKKWNSSTGFKGLARKSVIMIVLMVAVLLDRLLNDSVWVFRTLVCYFYSANEGLSILENCALMGLPVPGKLKKAMAQLRENSDSDTE